MHFSWIKAWSLSLAVLATLGVGPLAGAQGLSSPTDFNIAAQKLATALLDFSKQAGVQVLTATEIVSEINSPAIRGHMKPTDAIAKLLQNTQLKFHTVGDNAIAIDDGKSGRGELKSLNTNSDSASLRLSQVEPQSGEGRTEASASADEASRAAATIQEVVVTAQKREQALKDVPISISVLTGEQLDSAAVTGVTEALRSVPGVAVTVHNQNGGTQMSIRGVAANRALFGGSSPVAYYLDSVPFGFVRSAAAPDSSAYDLSRIEVLRGPQGTLFGASALNGVVRVLTNDADLNQSEFKARTSVSTIEDGGESYRADVAGNIPLIEGKLAARAVLGYQDISGWIDKAGRADANDAEIGNYRFRLRGQPTENLSVGLSTWFSRADYGAPPTGRDDRTSTATIEEPQTIDYDVYGLTIGYDFANFSLNSSTSLLSYDNRGLQDVRPIGLNSQLFTGIASDVVTQEVNLTSSGAGPWRWTAGGIYREGEDHVISEMPGVIATSDSRDRSESFAVFAELTRLFLDGRLELTGGVRYFKDQVQHSETLPTPYESENEFHNTSPRLVLSWHVNPDTTMYASYAQGFRSGQLNLLPVLLADPSFPQVEPDTLENYEIGAKGSVLNGRVRYDTAVYYVDWQDAQMNLSVLINNVPFPALTNGDSASGLGFDLALFTEPVDGLELGLNFGFNDLSSDTDVIWATAAGPRMLIAKGERLNYSPELTAGASVRYTWPLGARLNGELSAGADYVSRQDFHNIAGGVTVNYAGEPILVSRAGFSLQAPDHWRATLFVDNANDEDRPLIGATFGNPNNASHVRPRTIGLQLEYQFGRP